MTQDSPFKKKAKLGFGINDCPLWLFKRLDAEAKALFNDQYWVVLLDWYRKAEAYNALMQEGYVSSAPIQDEQEEKDEKPEVQVLGKEKVTKK